jgi:phosphoribosyl 1,2-cyclic phosphate phosphodiesterase
MKLQILGCGTSTGVPIPGCRCPVCLSTNPRNKRSRTSALIRAPNNFNILIDASIDLRYQALTYDIQNINAVLFTHAHADHILGIEDLRGYNFIQHSIIPCYAAEQTVSEIKRFFKYIFEPDPDYQGGLLAQLSMHSIDDYSVFNVGPVNIQSFLLKHGKTDVLGYRIGEVAYATDCNFIPDESKELLQGLKVLILDGLRYEEHRTHFTIPQAIRLAEELKVETTYLTHTTHAIDYNEVSANLPSFVKLAYDGLEIDF